MAQHGQEPPELPIGERTPKQRLVTYGSIAALGLLVTVLVYGGWWDTDGGATEALLHSGPPLAVVVFTYEFFRELAPEYADRTRRRRMAPVVNIRTRRESRVLLLPQDQQEQRDGISGTYLVEVTNNGETALRLTVIAWWAPLP